MRAQNTLICRIGQLGLVLFSSLILSKPAAGQCKTFKLSDQGDTLNCVDKFDKKQGKWIERTQPLRGSPGFDEEGEYVKGRKEGLWRRYNLQGDVLAMENYKWGLFNGKCQYFTLDGLEHEESYKALDPDKEYDTIDVPDLYVPDVYKKVVVKNEGYALKHGKWTYYDPRTGFILKTLSFIRDMPENPLAAFGVKDKAKNDSSSADLKKKALTAKTKDILEWEKKNAGKKKVTIRDGRTGY